jgi:hypothetical protein
MRKWSEGIRKQYALLICVRLIVEHVEERLDIKLLKNAWCRKQWQWCLRVVARCLVRIPGHVIPRPVAMVSILPSDMSDK